MPEPNTTEIDKPSYLEATAAVGCQFPNRLAITGIILDCIRQLFSNVNNLMHPQLKEFFWAADSTLDPLKAPYQVLIEDVMFFNLGASGIRPTILVKAGNWQESKIILGDNGLSGEVYYKKIAGTHSIQVLAKTTAQAELLAREVHGYLSHFGPILREWISLAKWEVPAIGEPSKAEGQPETVIISIGVSYEIIYSWSLHPETSRLLRQIAISAIMKHTDTNVTLVA